MHGIPHLVHALLHAGWPGWLGFAVGLLVGCGNAELKRTPEYCPFPPCPEVADLEGAIFDVLLPASVGLGIGIGISWLLVGLLGVDKKYLGIPD